MKSGSDAGSIFAKSYESRISVAFQHIKSVTTENATKSTFRLRKISRDKLLNSIMLIQLPQLIGLNIVKLVECKDTNRRFGKLLVDYLPKQY